MDIGGLGLNSDAQPPSPLSQLPPLSKLPEGPPAERLAALLEADFDFLLRDNPEFATQAGFHDFDAHLQDLSPGSWETRVEHNAEVLEILEKLDMEGMSDEQRLHAQLLKTAAQEENAAIELGCHLMPLNSVGMGGVHENFIEMLDWMRFESQEDIQKYLDRLMAFPQQVQGYQDLLAYGACMRGMPASKSMMRRVISRLKELIASDLAELKAPFKNKDIDEETVTQLEQAVENCFKSSLKRLLDFVEEFYIDRVREEPGCGALKNGAKVYAQCLRYHTTTDKTAEEIHEMGLKEVARIEGRFKAEVLAPLSAEGKGVAEFAKGLKGEKCFFWEDEESLLQGYKDLVARITEKLPVYFKTLPKMKLEVVRQTAGPAAFYMIGTADGQRPGKFSANVTRLPDRAKYEMPALALHEGVPGHHLQGALAVENEALPKFIRFIEDRRYEMNAARRPMYMGYLEGWALYCERLGEEMGMYTSPQELFGRLSLEMMRAVRLVVDTGIHHFNWSLEKATAYMEEKTGMAAKECEEEVHRYAAWPGQACAYKVGELALREMREAAEGALKEKFKVEDFHEVLLGAGPMPLDVLKQRVDAWIASA